MHQSENLVNFNKDSEGYVQAYTNGSCGTSIAKAGVGVWFGENHPMNISQPATHRATSSSAEIEACTRAIKVVLFAGERNVTINSDSKLVVNGMNEWLPTWKINGWKKTSGKPVKNKPEFQELDRTVREMDNVQFKYVPGSGIEENERARVLARRGAQLYGA